MNVKPIIIRPRHNPPLAVFRDASLVTGHYTVCIRQDDNALDDGNMMTPIEARRLAMALNKMADLVERSNREINS